MSIKHVMAVILTLSLTSLASAAFLEKFEGFADGDLPGQGAWLGSRIYGADQPAAMIGNVGLDNSKGAGNSAGPVSNRSATIPLNPADVPSDGTFSLYADVITPGNTNPSLIVGDGSLVAGSADGERVMFVTFKPDKAEVVSRQGSHKEVATQQPFSSLGWLRAKINIHLTSDVVTGGDYQYVDIDDTTGAELGAYSAPFAFSTDGHPGFALTHAALMTSSYVGSTPHGRVDNFGSVPLPEPASAMLLGLGGLMMLRRRREA